MIDPSKSSAMNSLPPNLLSLDPAEQAIQMELEHRRNENGCRYFEPNGPQTRFVELLGVEIPFIGIFSAANGLGKTTLIVNILASIIWGPRNKFFDFGVFHHWPYPKRFRFVTDPKLLEEIGPFHTEVKKWWPRGKYEAIKSGKSYFSQYKANGFLLDVMSYDQALEQFEGSTLGGILFDEPPVRAIWNASIARLRMGGMALVFMTPLTEAAWFFDEVVPKHAQSVVYGDIEENCKQHGIRGQLEHVNIERMVDNLDPDEVEARAHGKAMYLKGLIYKSFEHNIHVAKKPIPVPSNATVYQVVDPAVDKPFASIWAFPDTDGTLYIVDEWPNEDFYRMHGCDLGLVDYKRLFLTKEQGWNVQKRIIDRHFADVRSLQTKNTLRQDFAAIGMHYEASYNAQAGEPEVETGIIKVRSYLHYKADKPIDSLNRPRIVISPVCKNTIKGFQRWSFDMSTGKPQDSFKDYMDCVRYLVMADPKVSYSPPINEPRRMFA